ncbi:hypothetical protein PRK78_000467 [Emydomyces testavorans]|uniref:Transcription elongation factor Eaf N-terminal domain-containing protein n=1 Tax=Emydomyces testavorans TaxID=2070801 RepID=A0AAF0DBH1_9EURO|nr:hypothetical protein PRK78_000467 [Emydomyces testavorans]
MAALSAPPTPGLTGGLIDPTKQAEYPILLGDKLAGKESSQGTRFINVTYNYKTKGASPHQKTTITPGDTPDFYKLTIQDKASNAEQTDLTHVYHGSVDPTSSVSEPESSHLVLVFDPTRKAFILEPVSTKLNFNLRSAPGKTEKQVVDQYQQLSVLSDSEKVSGDDGPEGNKNGDDTPEAADKSNPYDYRHFLPKKELEGEKKAEEGSSVSTPDPHNLVDHALAFSLPPSVAAVPKPKPKPRTKPQANPLRPQQKRASKPPAAKTGSTSKAKPKPRSAPRVDLEDLAVDSSPSEEDPTPTPAAATSSSNVIDDDYLIIDMGSPPPERPKFKLNPRHFASSNTSANEAGYASDDDEDDDNGRSPSPPRLAVSLAYQKRADQPYEEYEEEVGNGEDENEAEQEANDDMVDDDDLAAELEAAFEESAREEEEERARSLLLQQQQQQQQHIVSDDESEVSEEE